MNARNLIAASALLGSALASASSYDGVVTSVRYQDGELFINTAEAPSNAPACATSEVAEYRVENSAGNAEMIRVALRVRGALRIVGTGSCVGNSETVRALGPGSTLVIK